MVKIVVAGGSGQVAREVIDALIATKKHEITIFSRHETRADGIPAEVGWKVVDYGDKASLTEALWGIHTILSFVQVLWDPEQQTQKNIIEAAIAAGVKRFAPSEFGSKGIAGMSWSKPKELLREHLQRINADGDILEYTLFQPGLFLDYLAFPHKTSKYLGPVQTVFDFENRRALVVDGYEEAAVTFTTLADLAAIVTLAVDYDGKWPTTGGITGNRLTASKIIKIGKAVRGRDFAVERAKIEDLDAGELKTSWRLNARHHSVPEDQASEMLKVLTIGILLGGAKGSWDSSDEWNRIFPDYKFIQAEEYLAKIWSGKP